MRATRRVPMDPMRRFAGPSSSILLLVGLLSLFAAGCRRQDAAAAEGRRIRAILRTLPEPSPEFRDISIRALNARTPVLMFHDVVGSEPRDDGVWFDVSATELDAMLERIEQDGGKVVSMDDLYRHLTQGSPIPTRAVVLTFDDSYEGVFTQALPVLRKHRAPFTVFVHTAHVGSRNNRPKMSWKMLQELRADGLATIGSHTVTHPDDITKLDEDRQRRELEASKATLERQLGIHVRYLSYPVGRNDETTRRLAREAGYQLAVTMADGFAEESPDILRVDRFEQSKFSDAWAEREAELANVPVAIANVRLRDSQVSWRTGRFEDTRLALVEGGYLEGKHIDGRKSVGEFVQEAGAVAGINGGFFAMAAIQSDDSRMIGPFMDSNRREFEPEENAWRLDRIRNRPVVVLSRDRMAILPFQPFRMNFLEAYRSLVPNPTDVFLAGTWLVHEGQARNASEITKYAGSDVEDPRRRAFVGVRQDGVLVLGASLGSIPSSRLARAAAAAGLFEAVLLDSGFSTSLVYEGYVLASGHSTPERPSRPVPHALVVKGVSKPMTSDEAKLLAKFVPTTVHIEANRLEFGD